MWAQGERPLWTCRALHVPLPGPASTTSTPSGAAVTASRCASLRPFSSCAAVVAAMVATGAVAPSSRSRSSMRKRLLHIESLLLISGSLVLTLA